MLNRSKRRGLYLFFAGCFALSVLWGTGCSLKSESKADLEQTKPISGIDERREQAAKRMMEEGDQYLDRIMNEPEGDSFTNHVLAQIAYRALLSFEISESLKEEYEDKLRRVEVYDNDSIYSGISKEDVHFIAVAYPIRDTESYEPTINVVTGNDKEYELFRAFLEPPGIADPIYYAVDLYAEDLLGEKTEFEIELSEPSVGAVNYPEDYNRLDANAYNILKRYNREAQSNVLQNKKWNLFLFQSYAVRPAFRVKYNGETIELKG